LKGVMDVVMYECVASWVLRRAQSERPLHYGSTLTGRHRQIGLALDDAQYRQIVVKLFERCSDINVQEHALRLRVGR
jgi:hypothetical protein